VAVRPLPDEQRAAGARPGRAASASADPAPASASADPAGSALARTARFIFSRRLYLPHYWMMVLRYLRVKLLHPNIRTDGFIFIERGVELYARRGHARLMIGRWSYFGRGNHIRCHEGNLTIGRKCVFGKDNTINCYLEIEVGDDCILADWVYICDFDHRFEDLTMPIRKQGIVTSPVRIGSDCWLGEKTTILRGVTVGNGSVIASHALVNADVSPRSVVGGVPAKVLKRRGAVPPR